MSEQRRRQRRPSLPAPVRWVGLGVRALLGPPARAVRGSAHRVADPARQVVDYWHSERVTMRQGFVAVLIASTTSLGAGLILAGMAGRLEEVPGLLVLIPVSIGMRGAIFGALSARLGTAIHTGLFEVSRDKAGILYQNVYAAALLTFSTALAIGILGRTVSALLHIPTVSIWDLLVITFVGGVLSSTVVLVVTVVLSVQSYRRSWDLDSVGAPLITAIGDIVTLPCLLLASYLVGIDILSDTIGFLALLIGSVALVSGWRSRSDLSRRIVRESFPLLGVAMVLDILAGAVIEPRLGTVFGPLPAFLIIIPAFLELTGALGSILAARLGSKLHLGAISPSKKPGAAALLDATMVLGLGITVYLLTGVMTLFVSIVFGYAHPGAVQFLAVVMIGGIMATLLAAVIGYYAATTTYRFGFDPDNHTIPLVTSGMDLMGVICLVAALVIVGVA